MQKHEENKLLALNGWVLQKKGWEYPVLIYKRETTTLTFNVYESGEILFTVDCGEDGWNGLTDTTFNLAEMQGINQVINWLRFPDDYEVEPSI